jgi:hypothetical protein
MRIVPKKRKILFFEQSRGYMGSRRRGAAGKGRAAADTGELR